MSEIAFEQKFKIRFNLQTWLKEDIGEYDALRIGNVLGIDPESVSSCISELDSMVETQALRIDQNSKYSGQIAKMLNGTVVFIGDSITSDRLSFAKIIRKIFAKEHSLKFVDAGVSGWRTTDFVDELYGKVLNSKAEYAHIMLGTNGVRRSKYSCGKCNVSPNEYSANLDYIICALAQSGTKVIISTLPPYNLNADTYQNGNWTIRKAEYDEYNGIIESCESKPNVIVNDMRDIYDKYNVCNLLEDDGVHLNTEGHCLLAENLLMKLITLIND